MTPAQLLTLKTFINQNPTWAAMPVTQSAAVFIADELNKEAAPAFVVWRTAVPLEEIMRNGMDWARVDNLSVGKARIWDWLGRLGTIDPSKPNIRVGIDSTWVGTAADLAVRASVYTHCKRNATIAEKLFATGTGSDAVPATMGFEGVLSADSVAEARELA